MNIAKRGDVSRIFRRRLAATLFDEGTMNLWKRPFLFTAVLGSTFVLLGAAGGAAVAPIKNIILVHGAWADGSSWSKLIPLLQAKGLNVVAVQLPMTSLEADADVTRRAIADADGPVFLIGHSYGGSVITEGGNDPKVVGMMYIAAGAPDVGESFADQIKPYPPAPALSQATQDAAGFFRLTPRGMAEDFAPDLTSTEANVMTTLQGPLSSVAFGQKATQAAWKTRPTWFIVAGNDRVVPIALERAEAARMKATTITIASSHVIMLSHPQEVFNFIESALRTLQR
jgi:pimeloyl-ACP methyl ester carboxylesterase